MTELTPEVIQAEIENLEHITPASDYHIVLLPLQSEKTKDGIIKSPAMLAAEKATLKSYIPIVKANPFIESVKAGMGLLPVVRTQKGVQTGTWEDKVAYILLPLPTPVTEGVGYALIRNGDVLAFQTPA